MIRFKTALFLSTLALSAYASDVRPSNALTGLWRYDASRSTELSPWKSFDLTLKIEDGKIIIHRQLSWSRRVYEDTTEIELSKPVTIIPVEMWPDNRHLGVYIGGDRSKRVHAGWIDDRRILRVNTDLTLDAQQGPRAVNILSDYKVSANGSQLTLTELRSTRNRPIVCVFNRVEPGASKP